jgi:flagellar M-ring protein FliF
MEPALQNLLSLWSNLSVIRRVVVIGATIAMFLAVVAIGRMGSQPSLTLLYAGLDDVAAGEIIAALDQQGTVYEVRAASIYVSASDRDRLRMTLASEGLPAAGSVGYELLDSLTGFGTTSQMFDAAYWRAKEGELARTIQANPAVRSARVHIASSPNSPFRGEQKSSASITISTANGGLNLDQALALRHLVAAAVPDLLPQDVALIDTVAGLIPFNDSQNGVGANSDDRAAVLKANLERLLEARVGVGKAIVEVTVEIETDREEISERVFDPAGRVAISTETEEQTGSIDQNGGAVTVASNLPEGDASGNGGEQSQTSETRERVNYEVSETSRAILRNPGAIKKLSVAVLLDEVIVTAADGTQTREPRSVEELEILRELVASGIGFDEARGDVLTVKSLAFQTVTPTTAGTEAIAAPFIAPADMMQMIQIAVFATVALVLGLFVVRPILTTGLARRGQLAAADQLLALPPADRRDGPANLSPETGLNGEIQDGFDWPQMVTASLDDPSENVPRENDPVSRLRRLIEERQGESIEILRGWMEKEEEKT